MVGDSGQWNLGGQQDYGGMGTHDRTILRTAGTVIGIVLFVIGLVLIGSGIHSIWEVLRMGDVGRFRETNLIFSLLTCASGAVHVVLGWLTYQYSRVEFARASRSRIIGLVLLMLGFYLLWSGAHGFLNLATYVLRLDMGVSSFTIESALISATWLFGGFLLIALRGSRPGPYPY